MGTLFPLAVSLYVGNTKGIGQKVGKAYFVNTMGAVAGSLLSGLVFIPFAGIKTSSALLAIVALTIGFYTCLKQIELKSSAATLGKRILWHTLNGGTFATLAIASLVLTQKSTAFYHTYERGRILHYYAEGITATVTVVEQVSRRGGYTYKDLYVDRQSVAGDSRVGAIDSKMLAHLPLLLSDHP